ncbi:hypothetical protein SASPL_148024 [Salvia splendens]|uniref:Uncharacterized protein n=1 Tax=Salvia splendens TaxID=180675 RepID=A0A8X8W8J4_SALSN|nr:uncharacterized protein LOC121780081 [Salvia splendens]KAG6390292.1 hypothetical protein SASPL_148024 [Salvia splendens]
MSKFICFVAILCVGLFEASMANRCPTDSVKIEQVPTGRSIESKPEWKVKVSNQCACTLTLLKLTCPKFLPSIEVKPPVISIDEDGHCLVKTLNPLYSGEFLEFSYAWDPIQLQVLDFIEACS